MERVTIGLERGTDNILKRTGYSRSGPATNFEDKKALILMGGHSTDVQNKLIKELPPTVLNRLTSPFQSLLSREKTQKLRSALLNRHEAYESLYAGKTKPEDWAAIYKNNKMVPKALVDTTVGATTGGLYAKDLSSGRLLNLVGSHTNLGVLGRESRDISLSTFDDKLSPITKFRNNSGENALLQRITGKGPASNLLDRKAISQLAKSKPDRPVEVTGNFRIPIRGNAYVV